MTGTISWKLASKGQEHYSYDFGLLSGAAGLIYGYTGMSTVFLNMKSLLTELGIIPIGLWATLKWFGSESANLMECWALYGYANLIWIPVALISWSPISSQYTTPLSQAHWKSLLIVFKSPQLCLRWDRLRSLSPVPFPKPLPRPQRHRCANIKDSPYSCGGVACWASDSYQDPIFCAQKPCCEETRGEDERSGS
jgi:hypothetical protein